MKRMHIRCDHAYVSQRMQFPCLHSDYNALCAKKLYKDPFMKSTALHNHFEGEKNADLNKRLLSVQNIMFSVVRRRVNTLRKLLRALRISPLQRRRRHESVSLRNCLKLKLKGSFSVAERHLRTLVMFGVGEHL